MAEIPIQRKAGMNIWPWIIGLIVLALLGWYLFGRNHNNVVTTTPADSTMMMTAPAGSTAPAGTMTPGTTTPGTMTPGTMTPGTTTPGTPAPSTP